MNTFAPLLEAFFTERLLNQRQASPHTVAAYRDTFRLLLVFAEQATGKAPSNLDITDVDAPLVTKFLDHLQDARNNGVRTRNLRLTAVHSLFRYASFQHPEHAALIQRVLAIPPKRFDKAMVTFLAEHEADALLAAPDRTRWLGRRDHALLATALQTGLRVSELTGLTCADIELGTGAHLRCHGKGRKERTTPLTAGTTAVLRVWLRERSGAAEHPLFPGPRGAPLSRDAVRRLVARHVATATEHCSSLGNKTITVHTLRHTAAMRLLQAGVDTSVIALWLGHEQARTTQIYLHADLQLKERAIARTAQPQVNPGRYRPPDSLLAFLEGL
ncbi:Site-specific recombinase XerD [Brevibacterium sp. Mu109]|uniref:tyrosine-type recombinase/integrase n=1 Tax=Brevibacterium sp. Mu109 TaxID=1255669 RepID=UPI000C6ADCB8|nr:tyrosine-type recombinase/integrase [Brevibacterium sp. Mu109]SMX95406.1 Site-specific recombinase XerD [Brevibacterium sp. Mu109]